MTAGLTSATRLIALLGNPVAHSASPVFQNAAFRHAGLDAVYLALRCDEGEVPGLVRGIALGGGGGNVTVPHKEVAARAVERRTEAVMRTGACNTYWSAEGVVFGDNTDVVGSSRAIRSLLGRAPAGARVLLVGAGGAARAALAALVDEQVDEVVLLNRTPTRAEALARRVAGPSLRTRIAVSEEELAGGRFDLAINTTPLGLHAGDAPPLSERFWEGLAAAFDMAYRPGGTEWVRRLRQAGIPAADGAEMLLWQGVAAFERWWDVPAPVEVMRAAIGASMGGEVGGRG